MRPQKNNTGPSARTHWTDAAVHFSSLSPLRLCPWACGGPAKCIKEREKVIASPTPSPGEREISGLFRSAMEFQIGFQLASQVPVSKCLELACWSQPVGC